MIQCLIKLFSSLLSLMINDQSTRDKHNINFICNQNKSKKFFKYDED